MYPWITFTTNDIFHVMLNLFWAIVWQVVICGAAVCVWRKECDGCSLSVVRSYTFGLDIIFRVCRYSSMRFVLVRQNWQNVFIFSCYFSIDFKFNTYAINWKYTYSKLRNFFVNAHHLWLFLIKICLRIRVFWIRHHILACQWTPLCERHISQNVTLLL
jgi:hypothetical protein